MLVFDDPTALCGNSPHSILDFVEYDWVGAAWKWAKPNSPHEWGGNGALSLRSRSMVLRLLDAELADANQAAAGAAGVAGAGAAGAAGERGEEEGALHIVTKANEDMWFIRQLFGKKDEWGLKLAPKEVSRVWAVEEMYDGG